jgi:hypothetical protein
VVHERYPEELGRINYEEISHACFQQDNAATYTAASVDCFW